MTKLKRRLRKFPTSKKVWEGLTSASPPPPTVATKVLNADKVKQIMMMIKAVLLEIRGGKTCGP